ncbi:MAG: TRAP transporter permease [Bilophila wadsworthia]
MSTTDLPDDDTLETLSEEGYTSRKPTGALKYLYYAIGLGMAAFHIWFLGYSSMEPWALYYSHICFGVVLAYFLYPFSRRSNKRMPTLGDWACMLLAASACIYFILELDTIIYRVGVAPTSLDLFFSTVIVVLILEMTAHQRLDSSLHRHLFPPSAARKLPYSWQARATASRVFSATSPEWTVCCPHCWQRRPRSYSSFSVQHVPRQHQQAVLHRHRHGRCAASATGRPRYVIGSALFGTISGNSAATVASGTFTIPMMIGRLLAAIRPPWKPWPPRAGMTPPILGAAAFIIAELTGTPYLDVALATVIPAILYFVSIFYMIDLEAYKEGLHGYAKDELPDARKVLLERGHLVIPIFVLIFVLIGLNASVIKAAIWAIYSTILCTFLRKSTRLTPEQFVAGFADGAKQAVGLIAACATAGIIIGVLNLTGTGLKFASGIIALSGGILPIALILTMGSSLILGMGLPTAAAYLICAAVIVPALTGLGVPALTGHLFIFYFACLSAITPPVALAAFTAASLGKTKPMGVALTAVRLGIVAFIVPFMFVYAPSLLWQGSLPEILGTLATSLCGVFFLGSALQGAFRDRVPMGQRGLLCFVRWLSSNRAFVTISSASALWLAHSSGSGSGPIAGNPHLSF